MAVALAPTTHDDMGDAVVVGSEDLLVPKHLVTEGVQVEERNPDVGGGHPVLQLWVRVKLVGAWG